MKYAYRLLAILFVMLSSHAYADTLCLPAQFLINTCATSVSQTISSSTPLTVASGSGNVLMIELTSGNITAKSLNALSGSTDTVFPKASDTGSMSGLFNVGTTYYIPLNNIVSVTFSTTSSAQIKYAIVGSSTSANTNLTAISNNIESLDYVVQAQDQEYVTLINQIGQVTLNYIPNSSIGAASGVAGLTNGNITNPINTTGSITDLDSYTSSSGTQVNTPRVQLQGGALDDLAGGPDSIWLGGSALPAVTDSSGDPATSAIVNIMARPYGNYNNGCALCLMATGGTQTDGSGRAAISGGDWHEGVSANNGMGDIVGFYEHLDNSNARLILPVVSYTATSVVLSSSLTAEQINQLRPGMYIWSNSIDSNVTDTGTAAGSLPTPKFYGGYITSWSGNTINVNGWSVYEQTPVAGAVPDTKSLDTSIYSSRTTPTVWVGSPGKVFARNVYNSYNEQTAGSENSLAHEYQIEEADFATYAKTKHSVKFSGYVISPQSNGTINDGTEFTEDSSGLVVAGSLPIQIMLWGGCNSSAIYGQSIYVASHCSNFDTSTAVGSTYTLSENVAIAGGMTYRQITRLQQDTLGANPNLYVGPVVTPGSNPSIINRTQSWYGKINGYVNGAIRYGMSDSSVALCGSGTLCGLVVGGSGDISITSGHTLQIQPSTADNTNGAPFFSATSGNVLSLKDSGGTPTSLNVSGSLIAAGAELSGDLSLGAGNTVSFTSSGTVTSHPFLYASDSNTLSLLGSAGSSTDLSISGSVTSVNSGKFGGVQSSSDIEAMNGHSVVLHPSTVDNVNGSPYFSASSGTDVSLGNSGGTNVNLAISGSVASASGVFTGSMTLTTLNNVYRPSKDGTQMWCSDCTLNSNTGVLAIYHSTGTKWTDMQNNALAN